MRREETELEQADRLSEIVENVSSGEGDMFDGIHPRRLSRAMMELVDLAVFILPIPKDACRDNGSYEQIKEKVLSEMHPAAASRGTSVSARRNGWIRPTASLAGAGLAIAAFFLALLIDPVPAGSREGRSIDTFGQPWYNSQMVNCTLTSASDDNRGSFCYMGFHDAGSGFRAFVYK